MSTRTKFTLLVVLLLAWCSFAWAKKIADIRPQGYVTDLARVIDPATKNELETLCAELEQKTGDQIAVVTVNSLDGQSREDYAADLYKHLGVGSKKNDRGVLLLVAPRERQYKIEVGYGLEPVINDARAGDVGREMVPDLRRGDYSAAVLLGTTRLAQLIAADKGVRLNGAPAIRPRAAASQNSPLIPLLVVVSVFVILGIISRLLGGRGSGGVHHHKWTGEVVGAEGSVAVPEAFRAAGAEAVVLEALAEARVAAVAPAAVGDFDLLHCRWGSAKRKFACRNIAERQFD